MWYSKEEIARKRERARKLTEFAERVKDDQYEATKTKIACLVSSELNLHRELCHRGPFKGSDGNPKMLLFAELAWKALKLDKKWPRCGSKGCSRLANYPDHGKPSHCYMHIHLAKPQSH